MKHVMAVVMILVPLFAENLPADTDYSRYAFALGLSDACKTHKSWPWLGAGLVSFYSAFSAAGIIDVMINTSRGYDAENDNPVLAALPWIGFGVVAIAPYIPALVFVPAKSSISPSREGIDLECYRTGYLGYTRLKNAVWILLGQSITAGGMIILMCVFFSALG